MRKKETRPRAKRSRERGPSAHGLRNLLNRRSDRYGQLKDCFPGTWEKDMLAPRHLCLLYNLMAVLPFMEWPPTAQELADRLQMPLSTFVDCIRDLKRAGLLTFDEEDRTPAGHLRWCSVLITCRFIPEVEIP